MEKTKIIVETDDNDIRLDSYLADNLNKSRNYIQKLIENKSILVNNELKSKKYIVSDGDEIEISFDLYDELEHILPIKMDLDIVYEDDDLIIINKPKGLVVHPGAGNYDNTLVNGLIFYTRNLSDVNGLVRPGIVHRIDKDTSGLLVVCKNNDAHNNIAKQLSDKTCYRKYICVVEGTIANDEGTIDAPIGRDTRDRKKMCVTDRNSKNAVTHFKVLERFANYTLLECQLETGRTHQIRVHMAYINHPIVNDPVYNKKQIDKTGQYLHAFYLSFIHPKTNERVKFKVDTPLCIKDFVTLNGGKYFI